MVLSFIDTQNGTTFNGDQPFVFWFDEGQSVNLIYIKRIAFLSNAYKEQIEIDGDSPFTLIDTSKFQTASQITVSDEQYFDITDVSTNSVLSMGTMYMGNFVHVIYVAATSQDAGQFKSIFTIGGKEYFIGADFYNQDETLSGNLENLGIEIPGTVQKAIYETNVHEEAADNITMNRKWKELLLEYWRIVACKGSYRSLVSSLKWFEYGDLIKILEYWKRTDVGKPILLANDIEQILTDLFREQLSVLSKTTYIGLYLALERPSADAREDDFYPFYNSEQVYNEPDENPDMLQWQPYDGHSVFQLNENNPVLMDIAAKWSAQDLALKMTLVGNFFATYFMPIHLDLIHSTIENITFTNAIKVMTGGMQTREEWVHCSGNYRCTSFTDGADFYMQPVDCEVGPLTILGLKNASFDMTQNPAITNEKELVDEQNPDTYFPTVLGYNLELGNTTGSQDGDPLAPMVMDIRDILFDATNRYEAYGAPVRFDIEILDPVTETDFIKAAQIHWRRNGNELFDYRDSGIYIEPFVEEDENSELYGKLIYRFSFNVLIEREGKYDMSVIFESSKGIWYSKKFSINVLDNADNHVSIYKITKGDINTWKDTTLKYIDGSLVIKGPADNEEIISDVNEYMFSAIDEFTEMKYSQFIHASASDFTNSVGLNHVIMFPVPIPNNGQMTLVYGDGSASVNISAGTTVSQLEQAFPNYWWLKKDKAYIWMKNMNDTEQFDSSFKGDLEQTSAVIIGVRKYFTVNDTVRQLARKRYTKGNKSYEVNITQAGDMMNVSVRCLNGPGSSTRIVPLAKEVEVDILGVHKAKIKILPDGTSYNSNRGSKLGNKDFRVYVKGYCSRLVDEDRFVPLFHKLVPITDKNYEFGPGETALAIPHFRRSQQDKIDDITISFKHCGTADLVDKKEGISAVEDSDGQPTKVGILLESGTNTSQMVVANYKRCTLTKGYYDVIVRYKYNGNWHTEVQEGAFRIC